MTAPERHDRGGEQSRDPALSGSAPPSVLIDVLGSVIQTPESASEEVAFADGEALVEEGATDTVVHVLVSGTVNVVTDGGLILDMLGRGDVIGELSILAGGPRTATVRASGQVVTRRFERAEFTELMDSQPDLAEKLSTEATRRIDERRLAGFAQRMLGPGAAIPFSELRQHLTWEWVRAGEPLYRRGDPGDAGYLIVIGRFVVIGDEDGEEVPIGEVGHNQFIGESGIFEGRPRQVSVTAIRDSLVARVSQTAATELLGRHPEMLGPLLLDITRRASKGLTTSPKQTCALAVTASTDARVLATRLVSEIAHHGSCGHLWSKRVDSLLSLPGASDTAPGEPSDVRLSQLLHEFEVAHDHVVFEIDPAWSAWSARVSRQADRLVAVVSPRPGDEEAASVDRFFAAGSDQAERVLVVLHPIDTDRPSDTARWVERWNIDRILHMRSGSGADMQRVGRMLAGRPFGLVLGGGGARGFAHVGVRKAMVELGIPIDMVGGSSIGSPLGVGIAMDLAQEEYEAVVARLFKGVLDYTLPMLSLVKGERITASITEGLGGWTFEDLWRPFFCVSTNLTKSREMIHRRGDVVPAVRASVSIPGVMPPVAWEDDLLVDGGVLNNLPADIMRAEIEGGTVIAVDVAPPSGPRAKRDIALSVSGWEALRAATTKGKPSYPGITALMMRTMIAGSIRERSRMLARGDVDLYLDLDLRGVSLLDFDSVAPVVQAGYEAAMPRLEAWLTEREAGQT